MPAKSKAQERFIMANPGKFGGKKKAIKEWLKPAGNVPERVKHAKKK
jgi:hypothetical protein